MRLRAWQIGVRKKRVVPVGEGFTGKDREDSLKEFLASPTNKKLWERLEETRQRLPWIGSLVDDLQSYAGKHGTLTDKQKSLATSIYIDACVTSDDKLFEQVETRKLGYRLLELGLSAAGKRFILDVMDRANSRPFSLGQIRAINDIAKRQCVKLTQISKLTDETFDGWFLIEPKVELDKSSGL